MPNMENMDSTPQTEFNQLWRGLTVTSLKFAVDCEFETAPFEERASCSWHASSERKKLYRCLLFCAFQPDHYDIKLQEDIQEVSFAAFRYLLYEIP